jgi:hypothetical protein
MAGGGGGGGAFSRRRTPEQLLKIVRETEDKTKVAAFETQLAGILGDLLAEYSGRDPKLTRERLEVIKEALKGKIEGSFDQLFGGSVAKYTHVEGLSDIDSLVFINDTTLEGKPPEFVLAKIEQTIKDQFNDSVSVHHGRMAVSIQFEDGMLIQVLPAIKTEGARLRVPSSRGPGWSEIDPKKFTDALTRHNQKCGGKLVPTIKLAKAINGQLPEAQRLSGYHMESLGIAAFREYEGARTTTAMLPYFFEKARELVLAPIRDRTGQSIHVDEYLGPAKSDARKAASHVFDRLARRMRNASAAGSSAQWLALFGIEQ